MSALNSNNNACHEKQIHHAHITYNLKNLVVFDVIKSRKEHKILNNEDQSKLPDTSKFDILFVDRK